MTADAVSLLGAALLVICFVAAAAFGRVALADARFRAVAASGLGLLALAGVLDGDWRLLGVLLATAIVVGFAWGWMSL